MDLQGKEKALYHHSCLNTTEHAESGPCTVASGEGRCWEGSGRGTGLAFPESACMAVCGQGGYFYFLDENEEMQPKSALNPRCSHKGDPAPRPPTVPFGKPVINITTGELTWAQGANLRSPFLILARIILCACLGTGIHTIGRVWSARDLSIFINCQN